MADRQTAYRGTELLALSILASTAIAAGHLVAVNSTGYALPAADAAGLTVMGMSDEAVDNSAGASGAQSVIARRGKAFLMKNDSTHPVTQADIGRNVYVTNSTTVNSHGGDHRVIAGRCTGIESGGVWVEPYLGWSEDTDLREIPDPGDEGAIPASRSGVCALTTASAETRTLADPEKAGLMLTVTLDVDGGNCVVTAESAINQTGNNTITMGDAGDTLVLASTQVAGVLKWRMLVNDGNALTTV